MISKNTNKDGVKLLATVAVMAMVFAAVGICIVSDSDAGTDDFNIRFSSNSNLSYEKTVDEDGNYIFTVRGFTVPAEKDEKVSVGGKEYSFKDLYPSGSGDAKSYTYMVLTGTGLNGLISASVENPALKVGGFYGNQPLVGLRSDGSKELDPAGCADGIILLVPQATSENKIVCTFEKDDESARTVTICFDEVTALQSGAYDVVESDSESKVIASKDLYIKENVKIKDQVILNGHNIYIAPGKTLTIEGKQDGAAVYSAITSNDNLEIIGGTLAIKVTGVYGGTTQESEATYGINVDTKDLTIQNCELNVNVSSSTESGKNDIRAFAIKALNNMTLDNVTGTVAGGNRAIQIGDGALMIEDSKVTLKGAEKAIQAKSGTVNIEGSDVTLDLVDPMVGSNTGADDRFGLKVKILSIDEESTLTTDGLRVLDTASVAGTLKVTYDSLGGRDKSEEGLAKCDIPAGLILYSESDADPDDVTTLTIIGSGEVVVEPGNAIAGKIVVDTSGAEIGSYDSDSKKLSAIVVTAQTTFSVGSLEIEGAYTTDASTGKITVTGDIKISGESDVEIEVSGGAKVTVPSGKTFTLNNKMTMANNSELNVVGDMVGSGKIEAATGATGVKINAVDPVAVQNMAGAGLTVTSNESSEDFSITDNKITADNARAIEALFLSYTAVYLKGATADVVIQPGVTLTIPSTGTLYLNGTVLKVGEDSTLNINGKVRAGAPVAVTTSADIGDSENSKITVEGNLVLDGADVRVPVDVDDNKAYVSISNAKTMKVEGSATSELDVGFGNTLVLTDITIPSGRAVNVYGTVQVNGTVTVSKGAQFNVYLGGEAQIIGNLVVTGVANVAGEMDVDGTVKVSNDNGGAFFNVLSGGKVTVSEKATMTVSKSKNAVENKLDVSGELDIEGTLVVTGTLKGTVNDKGTVTFNGKSENATIRLFDGVTITVTSVVGTVTLTDAGTVDVKDYAGIVASYVGNEVIVSDAKNVTVSAEITESVKAQKEGYTARYLVGTLTVSGVVTSVDESATAYSSVTVENSKGKTDSQGRDAGKIKDPSVMQRIIIGDITLGKNVMLDLDGKKVEVKGDVVANAKTSLVKTTQSAAVSGSITIGPDCGKAGATQGKLTVDAVMYTVQDAEANETTYYTTFDKALNAVAHENSYEVLGKIKVKGDLTIPVGYKVVLATGATLTIDSAGIITVADTALLDGAAGKIEVDGKLIISNKDSGLKYNTGSDGFKYQVYTENGVVATYTGLLGALEAAVSGDIITLMQSAKLNEDATIKDGVTLIVPRGITLGIAETADVKLTVNGTLNIQGQVEEADEKEAVIVVNGVIASTGTFVSADFGLKDYVKFSEKVDGKLTDFFSNLTYASQTVTEGDVTVYGNVSAGDITFQKAEKALGITVKFDATTGTVNTISVSSMTLSGATLQTVNGKVTGTVVAAAAGSDAEIQLNGVAGVTITSMSEPGTLGNVDYLKISGTNEGRIIVAKGTVTLGGDLVVGTYSSSAFVVADGATLNVVKTTSLTVKELDVPAGKTAYYGLTVDGTLAVNEGTLTVDGWALVNGAIVIEKSVGSKVNVKGSGETVQDPKIQINGTLDVKSTEDAPAKFTIAGTAFVGSAPTLGANGVVSGPVQIGESNAFLIVFAGADSASAEIIDNGTSDSKASEIYVNGIHYMTVYVKNTSSVNFNDVKEFIYAEGYDSSSIEGLVNGMPVGDASLSNYDRIDCTISASYVDLIYSEGVGLVMYIDGLGIQNFYQGDDEGYQIQIGTHTVSFAVMSGYDDSNVTVTVNGKAVGSDGKFQVTADMDEVIIIVSGATPSSTPAPTPVTPADDGDDEMGLTEYLLIVLVVLAAILVVVVAIRMMRS